MLSDDAIDNLVQPIAIRQEAISNYVIGVIAERVREIGTLSPSDIYKMQALVNRGADIRLINKALADAVGVQVKDIKNLIKTVALENYISAKPFYDYRHKSFIPFEKNEGLQSLVKTIGDRTADTYINLSNTSATGFLVTDYRNPTKPVFKSIENTYNTVIDKAIQAVQNEVVSYETATRRAIKELADSGIRSIAYPSGYTRRLDSAVRMNVMGGVNAINNAVQAEIGKQIGADGVELSAHINSAPDHEPFQGHVFTIEEYEKLQSNQSFTDIKGNSFGGVDRIIGEWNCRHYPIYVVLDTHKPKYSVERLEKMREKNAEGIYLPDGRHLTLYECTQMQRKLETEIRHAKDTQIAFRKAENREQALIYQRKVSTLIQCLKAFSAHAHLAVKSNRITVSGYRVLKDDI